MRVLARIGFTLTALTLFAPAGARAGLPIVAGMPWSPAQQMSPAEAGSRKPEPRLCAECLRKKMLKEGVRVPPAPPLPPGAIVANNKCAVCGRPAAVNAGSVSRPRRSAAMPAMADRSLPGRAVVGGEPTYVASGNDPAPIGVVEPRFAAAGPGPVPIGSRDASVMPTASVSSPSDPLMPSAEKQPHILTHLFGLSSIGRERSERRERRDEEKHARIAYGAGNTEPVQNVPASAVYGR